MSTLFKAAALLTAIAQGALALPSPSSYQPGYPAPRPNETWSNPIVDGWYADPDAIKVGDTYWIYLTVSIAFDDQTWFDAYSSEDLVTWTKQVPPVFAANNSQWANDAFWAPCTIERDGKFYFYYTANNPVEDEGVTGIGVAVSDKPGGPYTDLIDEPMIGEMINSADAMDQQVFVDDDGEYYFIWGGSAVNIAPLGDDMASIKPWDDGDEVKEITPNEGFGEGSYMMKHDGKYYFMWSEGGYGTPDYRVAYAMSDNLTGPFNRIGLMLSKDDVADGPGHHSIIEDDDGQYYIVYHRRIIGDDVADNRVIAVDRMYFNEDGTIKPVVMT